MFSLYIGFRNTLSSSTKGNKLFLQESKSKFQGEMAKRQVLEFWFGILYNCISFWHIIGDGDWIIRYQRNYKVLTSLKPLIFRPVFLKVLLTDHLLQKYWNILKMHIPGPYNRLNQIMVSGAGAQEFLLFKGLENWIVVWQVEKKRIRHSW